MSRPAFDATDTTPIDKRYEFVLLFDVTNGNPNGDPDADNAPRVDPETGHGLITDVCIKRKIRNFVFLTRNDESPNRIYVKERGILANEQREAYQKADDGKPMMPDNKPNEKAREWMCRNYFDVRTFGAVMTTGKAELEEDAAKVSGKKARGEAKLWNCGQVRGPVQVSFARSIDPIFAISHTITRVALTNATDSRQTAVLTEDGEEKAASGQMGRKYAVPYALYRLHGFVSPFLADAKLGTGFSYGDLSLLLDALTNLFTLDRSASRGEMEVRGLYLFEHASRLGNAPAHRLFDTIKIAPTVAARDFTQYKISVPDDGAMIADGVKVWHIV